MKWKGRELEMPQIKNNTICCKKKLVNEVFGERGLHITFFFNMGKVHMLIGINLQRREIL